MLYKQFYAITKEQLGNSSISKWEDYGLIIQKDIFEKIKQFETVNHNGSKNSKVFWITKNGKDTGIFHKIREYEGNNNLGNNINQNIENDIHQQNIIRIHPNNTNKKINMIQGNEISEDENYHILTI